MGNECKFAGLIILNLKRPDNCGCSTRKSPLLPRFSWEERVRERRVLKQDLLSPTLSSS